MVTNSSKRFSIEFWQGKQVLLTGHTGFKGAWLTLWLVRMGAKVTGLGLPPKTTPNLFTLAKVENYCNSYFQDVRDLGGLSAIVKKTKPEIVFHLAAQPLVRAGYSDPVETFSTNLMGTVNLLEALRWQVGVRAVVMVTTDKVYRNIESAVPYVESDILGGRDPYSASKAASEIVIDSYRDAFLLDQGIALASARAGNVIGGGDWSQDRLIPDALRAWQQNKVLAIRRPSSIRPWQHVLEPLAGYLTLAQCLFESPSLAGAYNFGPEATKSATVRDLIELARLKYGRGEVNYANYPQGPHEAGLLSLDVTKACDFLGVSPKWTLQEAVDRTMQWYKAQGQGASAIKLCEADFCDYEVLL